MNYNYPSLSKEFSIYALLTFFLVNPVDCVWSNWSQFSECSQTCGTGIKTRTRIVKTLNSFNGVPCDGPASETEYCQLRECPQSK